MSGMDELLDEAIAKAKEAGDSQLVEWLRMARGGKSAARWYAIKLRDLEAENAKLRELVRHMGACIQYLDRTDEDGGCVSCPYQAVEHDCGFEQRMTELGIEVE